MLDRNRVEPSEQSSERARALWAVAALRGEIREQELPAPGPDEVVVRARFSGISRGTESLVWRGAVPVSEMARMRCPHQAGEFPFPVKYGYSSVGMVEAGPAELCGRLVHCLHPHQTRYVVSASSALPLPAGLPARRAVLAANMETALNAVWDASPRLGDRVSVVGGGVVGALLAALVRRLPGVEVELIDVRAERGELASALGVGFATPSSARGERDVVFHASGSAHGLTTALALCANDSNVYELSWFGAAPVTLELGRDFHSRRLGIVASQVGSVSSRARRRFNHAARRALALELLQDDALDALIDGQSTFEQLPELMPQLAREDSGRLCHLVLYPEP